MASFKFIVIVFVYGYIVSQLVIAGPVTPNGLNSIQESGDQLTSGTEVTAVLPPRGVVPGNAKGDLKGSDSFGLGYYLPIVAPTLVKYHYPLVYYPATYPYRIHHSYGAYGFFPHGHGVIH